MAQGAEGWIGGVVEVEAASKGRLPPREWRRSANPTKKQQKKLCGWFEQPHHAL